MIRKERVGELELIEPADIKPTTLHLLNRVLNQNDEIIQMNRLLVDRLTTTAIYMGRDDES